MSSAVTLSGNRVLLRRWRDEDRATFADVNAGHYKRPRTEESVPANGDFGCHQG